MSFYIAGILLLALPSCSKNVNASGTNGNHPSTGDTTITTNPAAKYVVDTYAGGKITNSISGPGPLCVDATGVLYVSESNHNVVIKIDPLVQTIGFFSGSFDQPGCADDPFGSGNPSLTFPGNLWISSDQLIFIGDYGCGGVKVATTTGHSSAVQYNNPNNLDCGSSGGCRDFKGNIFMMDTYNGLFEVRYSDQILVNVLSGTDLGIASSMTMDASEHTVYLAAKHRIVEFSDGSLAPIAGDTLGNRDGISGKAEFGGSMSICMGGDGNIYVADTYNNSVRQVTPAGVVTTIAGDGKQGYIEGPGDKAEFDQPSGITFLASGGNSFLYVSDFGNNVIRRITLPK